MVSHTAKDLTAGTAGGILQVLVGQPFDIVGTLTPLLGIGVCVSIQFAALESSKRYFAKSNLATGRGGPDGKALTPLQLAAAGAFAGVANGFVSGPVEHIRIRLQAQPDKNRLYNGPWDAIKKISQSHGISGLYKGQVPTFAREALGYGAYFCTYEMLVQRYMRVHQVPREALPSHLAIAYGATAGYALWATIYPIDVIKTRIQTDGFSGPSRKYSSMLDCLRTILRTEGAAAFARGLGPTLVRSPLANGFTFLGFELTSRALNSAF
ncbi:mitochondrial carrier [Cantharellus anzutake]|uniref:mitochondrial carrier n=1 Tax=Cantharellus anzutake TaxID=1750568 RepID=UPI00190569A0|nr:mitochondrial carrier [Cantharellus anzutake]KAF8326646.1 mitochondrial carrier [Cantharellus anzutake]